MKAPWPAEGGDPPPGGGAGEAAALAGGDPSKLALSLALGVVISVMPVLGITTLFALALSVVFRLNHVAVVAANYLAYPAQILLFIPFFQAGAWLTGGPPVPFSLEQIQAELAAGIWPTVVRYAGANTRAMVAWLLFAPLATWLLRACSSRCSPACPSHGWSPRPPRERRRATACLRGLRTGARAGPGPGARRTRALRACRRRGSRGGGPGRLGRRLPGSPRRRRGEVPALGGGGVRNPRGTPGARPPDARHGAGSAAPGRTAPPSPPTPPGLRSSSGAGGRAWAPLRCGRASPPACSSSSGTTAPCPSSTPCAGRAPSPSRRRSWRVAGRRDSTVPSHSRAGRGTTAREPGMSASGSRPFPRSCRRRCSPRTATEARSGWPGRMRRRPGWPGSSGSSGATPRTWRRSRGQASAW